MAEMKKVVEWNLPIVTVSEANSSENVWKKSARHKLQRKWIRLTWLKERPEITLPCTIVMKRHGKKLLDAFENLPMAFKYIKDELANQIFPESVKVRKNKKGTCYLSSGTKDDDDRISWIAEQELAPSYSVTITIFDSS